MRGAVEVPLFGAVDAFGAGQRVEVDFGAGVVKRGNVVRAQGPETSRRYLVRFDDSSRRLLHPRFLRAV